jgi:hypothetical protein
LKGSRKQNSQQLKVTCHERPTDDILKKNLIMRNKVKSGDAGGHIFQGKVSDPSSLPDKLAAEQRK